MTKKAPLLTSPAIAKMNTILKAEAFLRLCAMILLVLTACLVAFNSQTKQLFQGYYRTASFKDLDALHLLVFIDSGAAVYNLLQLIGRLVSSSHKANLKITYKNHAWFCFLLDQAAVYVVLGATAAATAASLLAVTGSEIFQWMKLCDRYTRFCTQIGGALLCGFIATILMALVSSLSAFSVFRLYSPKHFLVLKAK